MAEELLLAIRPPGSIVREVSILQNTLFSARGCLSAVALPPLIPVRFLSGGARVSAARLAGGASGCFRAAGWVRGGAWLFLSVDSGGAWDVLSAAASGTGRPGNGPFPVFPGFFMGCGEAGGEGAEEGLAVPALSFSSSTLALIKLRTAPGEWWREVYTEIVEEAPLR